MRTTLLLLGSLLLTSCIVESDLDQSGYRCDQLGKCPAGQACNAGFCAVPGGGDAMPDASVDATPDAPTPDAAPLARCPGDCVPLEGDVFCLCVVQKSWPEAKDACEADGFTLARVDNPTDSALIRNGIVDPFYEIWLGGSDADSEGVWRWLEGDTFWLGLFGGDSPQGAYAEFSPMEPNDALGNEDCLGIQANGWNDDNCSVLLPYVCARPTVQWGPQ